MSDFVKEIHNMFDHIWDCEIDHPVYQDTVGELMEAVIQAYEKHNLTHGTNLASLGTDCISRQAAIDDIWTVSPLARLDRKWIDRWLRQLPPIQPKRGRWIGKYPVSSICSECGYLINDSKVKVFAFCPNCGADMRGEQE